MKTPKKKTAENFIKDIRRNTRRIFSYINCCSGRFLRKAKKAK